MLALNGSASEVRGFVPQGRSIVLRLRDPNEMPADSADVALLRCTGDSAKARANGFSAALLLGDGNLSEAGLNFEKTLSLPGKFDYLADGDILGFRPEKKQVRTLFRRTSLHNSFLVTERCNHYCLMCSQPPRNIDDGWILDEIRTALPLIDKTTPSFGFTGGEPLLDWQGFIAVLADCRDLLPQTAIHVLSNGRAFASTPVTAAWAAIRHPNLTVGIPIYSAVDSVHDYVVQALGAFDETVLGVLKLKDRGQRVEIRVVLHAITAPRIVETANWLARNLPFADHIAIMGLENTGFAIANDDILWIDPADYRDDLASAVDILAAAGVNVSIYNLPRCVLAKSVWPFAMQSISDWKNSYIDACKNCDERPRCSGFFTTGRPRYSRAIAPILSA